MQFHAVDSRQQARRAGTDTDFFLARKSLKDSVRQPELSEPRRYSMCNRRLRFHARCGGGNVFCQSWRFGPKIDFGMALARVACLPQRPVPERLELYRKSNALLAANDRQAAALTQFRQALQGSVAYPPTPSAGLNTIVLEKAVARKFYGNARLCKPGTASVFRRFLPENGWPSRFAPRETALNASHPAGDEQVACNRCQMIKIASPEEFNCSFPVLTARKLAEAAARNGNSRQAFAWLDQGRWLWRREWMPPTQLSIAFLATRRKLSRSTSVHGNHFVRFKNRRNSALLWPQISSSWNWPPKHPTPSSSSSTAASSNSTQPCACDAVLRWISHEMIAATGK